ncbi:MAG TPA: hypothetical protein VEW71_10325 [Allosphingosinicella sp.]|nr:hypothetical protein [Allosphingosinicella sp.]
MAKGNVGTLWAAFLLMSCASPPQQSLARPTLGSWLPGDVRAHGDLALTHRVDFVGAKLRICRSLRNISPREVVVMAIPPAGRSYGQFHSFYFGERGTILVERRWPPHSSLVSRPPPRDEEDESPFSVIPPGRVLVNCEELGLPRNVARFTVLSSYSSGIDADQVPRRLRENRNLFLREQGALVSNICFVVVSPREIRCEN